MSLAQAIDDAVAYVRAHPDKMTRDEVNHLMKLAERVYGLAVQAGLRQALLQVPELRPELESQDPPLPPVQSVTKLNLPGDWDTPGPGEDHSRLMPLAWWDDALDLPLPERPFLPCASPRWLQDMAALRELAESGGRPPAESGKQPADPPTIW